MLGKLFQRVSEVPTNPQAQPTAREFDVADLYRGPVEVDDGQAAAGLPLDEALARVEHHLSICPECREEFEALEKVLRAVESD